MRVRWQLWDGGFDTRLRHNAPQEFRDKENIETRLYLYSAKEKPLRDWDNMLQVVR